MVIRDIVRPVKFSLTKLVSVGEMCTAAGDCVEGATCDITNEVCKATGKSQGCH